MYFLLDQCPSSLCQVTSVKMFLRILYLPIHTIYTVMSYRYSCRVQQCSCTYSFPLRHIVARLNISCYVSTAELHLSHLLQLYLLSQYYRAYYSLCGNWLIRLELLCVIIICFCCCYQQDMK